MTSSSPSEFLTFMRTASRSASSNLNHPLVRRSRVHQPFASRPFASSGSVNATGSAHKKEHATDKTDKLDVQSASSAAGQASKASGSGGTATEQRDAQDSTSRAKKDHPEAPDVVIGMQDERGKKGH